MVVFVAEAVCVFWNYYPWVFELLRLMGVIPECDMVFLGTEA